MREKYFDYYILSYFNLQKITKLSQILHVLRGKRTASMFYLTEVNHWHHGFSIEKRIEKTDLKKIIHMFLQKNLLMKKEEGYLLTNKGKDQLTTYFDEHYFPKTTEFSNLSLYRLFWERIQLFTQVFSEYSYQNTQYVPIIKNPIHQENIRKLFSTGKKNIDGFFNQWVEEQNLVFQTMDTEKSDILANILTGHNEVGKTRTQIAKELAMGEYEFNFYLRDLLEEVLEIIKSNRKQYPLNYEIVMQLNEEVFLGLSQSTYQTYRMLKQGLSITQIARKRQLKESTVKEHILELAFIIKGFPVQAFVSDKLYTDLYKEFQNHSDYRFKQAVLDFEGLEFYQFRLVELERMRSV